MERIRSASGRVSVALGAVLLSYAAARVLEIAHSPIPQLVLVALDVLSAMAFALVDGTRRYGLRHILVFAGICAAIGNGIENLSIATGFPFGRYEFLSLMGPKLFQVPVLLGLAYIGMAYVSWVLAGAVLGDGSARVHLLARPLLASLMMTAWDLAQDPVWATILRGWIWYGGGAWFGVPVSSFIGWLGTVFAICLCFALYLRRYAPRADHVRASVVPPLVFYLLCALGNAAQVLATSAPAVVQDPSGKFWRTADILHASAFVSLCIMGAFAALAWLQSRKLKPQAPAAVATD